MIIAEELTKRYSNTVALDGISSEIKIGERVGIVGRNGSGKTTFFRCLLGLCCYEGSLRIDGLDCRSNRKEVLKFTAYVPQIPPPLKLSVKELMQMSSQLCNVDVNEIIEKAMVLGLDIPGNLKKQFSKLSGGMKQKLLISIALSRKPKLLIMDEPSSNLDPVGRKALYNQLLLLPEDTTVVLSSHRVEELKSFITRIIELDMGRVVSDVNYKASFN